LSIRVALIGRGMAGTVFHAPLIGAVPEMELAAVAGSADAAAAIADPGIDLVVVATPNRSHFPLAEAALLAGKHVVVDKPFAVTSVVAEALINLAARQGRLLSVFQNRRWDGDFLTVRSLIDSGRLGRVTHYEAHWDRFRPEIKPGWREVEEEGAGLFFDLGAHLIDQALVLFGPPDAIAADIAAQRDGSRVDDYFALTLFYGRIRAILSASTLIAAPRPRFTVAGTLGAYVKHHLDPQEASLKEGRSPLSSGFGGEPPELHGSLVDIEGKRQTVPTLPGRYLAFYEAVADAILRGAPPPVDPSDAWRGLRLIELAHRSDREGRRIAVEGTL
jgi:scyllo-inositol 2-dehydrogenase (NADP+)